MRVIVAAQDAKLRAALCVWLGHMAGMELSGVARNSRELLPTLRIGEADLLILDWDLLAGKDEILLAQAQRLEPPPRIIIVCWQPELACDAAEFGIAAVVDKAQLPDSLFQVLGAHGSEIVQR
jgi:DNA-binding NarL/FixJ family response regulator